MRAGSFELLSPIGRGGHGSVWRARHVDSGATVALKVVPGDVRRRALLREELAATAALSHPAIVQVLDHGILDGPLGDAPAGSSWFALELADLGDATSRPAPWGWPELRHLLSGVLDALAHAHARGILHFDVKPANVVLASGGRLPVVRITDFGMALVWERLEQGGRRRVGGTPRYMPPEQFSGSWALCGPATDLYAVGVMAWELAVGRAPFDGTAGELARAHALEPVPRLPSLTGFPDDFEDWLRRLLQKRPDDRFACAADALHALRSFGDTTRGVALPSPPPAADASATLETYLLTVGDMPTAEIAPGLLDADELPPILLPPPPADWRHEAPPVDLAVRRLASGPRMLPLRDPPVVGREAERDALWAALRRVHAEGRPVGVCLEGRSGLGRSRLGRWLVERAEATGAAVGWRMRGDDDDPLCELALRVLRCAPLTDGDRRVQIDRITSRLGLDRRQREALHAVVRQQPVANAARQVALVRLLAATAAVRPVILWIDDANGSAEAVGFARRILARRDLPVLVVVGVAADQPRPAALEAVAGHRRAERIVLGPLSPADHARLIGELLYVEGELAARIGHLTSGNPGFAVEVVRDQVDRELLVMAPHGLRLVDGVDLELPADVRATWATRISALLARTSEGSSQALELAAVLGLEVADDEWAAVSPDEALRRGVRGALLEARLAVRTDRGWRFADSRAREAVLALAEAEGRLPAHHSAVADLLVARGAGPVRLAPHLVAAERWVEAREALRLSLWATAFSDDGAVRGYPERLARFEETLDALGVPDDDADRLEVLRHRAYLHLVQGRLEEADLWVDRYLARARDPRSVGMGLRLRSNLAMRRGRLSEAEELGRRALPELERGGRAGVAAMVAQGLGELASRQGRHEEALRLLRDAEERFRRLDEDDGNRPPGLADSQHLIGTVLVALGRLDEARAHLRAALAANRRLQRPVMVAYNLNELAELARAAGDLEEAARLYGRAARQVEDLGADGTVLRLNLAVLDLARGEHRSARAAAESLRAVVDEEERAVLRRGARAVLLGCAAAEGDWSEWDALLQALHAIDHRGGDRDVPSLIEQAAERAARAGQRVRAARALRLAAVDREALSEAEHAAADRARAAALEGEAG